MPFLRTQIGTKTSKPSWWKRLVTIDTANPSYRGKHHLIHSWLIEFDGDERPLREIGLDENGSIVVAGPSAMDYGFWLDTNMRLSDFVGEPISEEHFEQLWAASGVVANWRGCTRTLCPHTTCNIPAGVHMKIIVSTLVEAPLQEVWRAYTTPDDIMAWNTASPEWHTTASSVDLRPGGKFSSRMEAKDGSFGFDFAGEYTRIVPYELIEYSFGDRVGLVEFTSGTGGIVVTVTFDSESTHSEEQQRSGWQAILDNFARYVKGKRTVK
jgi:uncharacterized protein YndB with AHSA1/START domain